MTKKYSWFKFDCMEWLTGDISLESYEVQGLFISICAYYWKCQGKVKMSKLKGRLRGPYGTLMAPLTDRFLRVNDDNITIEFLDEQIRKNEEFSKKQSALGKIGALKRIDNEQLSKGALRQPYGSLMGAIGVPKPVRIKNKELRIKEKEIYKEKIFREFKHLSITEKEVDKLKKVKGFSTEQIDDVLNRIENYRQNKNFTSLYLTALNWLNRDKEKISSSPIEKTTPYRKWKSE